MILREVLTKALQMLDESDQIEVDVPSKKLNKLISCANMIYSELTAEYVHLKNKETLQFEDGRLYYDKFTKAVKDIVQITQNGTKVPFKVYPLFVEADVMGKAEISYVYHPEELESIFSVIVTPPQYTSTLLATGIASEYYYRTGMVDEAIFFKNRYDNSVYNLSKRISSVNLDARRMR